MLEWYEAYADYEDTMRDDRGPRRDRRPRDGLPHGRRRSGDTRSTSRLRGAGFPFVESLEEHGLWTRDAGELEQRLQALGVDTGQDHDWAQLVDHAFSHFVEPSLIQPTIVLDYPVEISPFAR